MAAVTDHDENRTEWFQMRVEPSLLEALRKLARANERTMAAEARLAIKQHVEKETR